MPLDAQRALLGKLMDVAVLRGKVHAANLANQNTPGYRAQAVNFEQSFRMALAEGNPQKAASLVPQIYEPRNTAVDNDGNDVSSEREVLQSTENATLYNAYIAMTQGRQKLMNIAMTPAPG